MKGAHKPIVIEEFNGLWARGDEDSCPIDHFSECNNVIYFESGVETRPGIDVLNRGGPFALGDILRMYNYVMQSGESLLTLVQGGNLYHCLLDGSGTIHGPILTIPEMQDFAFQAFGGRAYITPFATYAKNTGEKYQVGLPNEFVYVYKGDGTPARKAAGERPTGGGSPLVAYSINQIGEVTQGYHVIGVAFGAGTEFTSLGPEGLAVVFAPGGTSVAINNIPLGPTGTERRKIYMTKAIDPSNWNPDEDIRDDFIYYFVKDIEDNTTISATISIPDEDPDPDNETEEEEPFLEVEFGTPSGPLPTPTNSSFRIANSATDGYCDLGLHVMGVVYETDTGYLTSPGPNFFAVQTFMNEQKAIDVFNIPVPSDPAVTKKHLVCTRALGDFNGNNRSDQFGYQMYFVGEPLDVGITQVTISFYDSELLEDASHLFDNFSEIPAGVGLKTYNGRMVLFGTNENPSLAYISFPGEPEAFDQVEGFVTFPLDGKPLTNAQEFRDTLYLFKQTKTAAVTDNGQSPAFWEGPLVSDHGIGASVHGVCQVLDSQGVNVDYILIVDWSGIMVFNGLYVFPPLTWKIENVWEGLDRNDFANIQIMNDSILHRIYMTLPDRQMLYGDWDNGMDAKSIKWAPWTLNIQATTIAIVETNKLLIGSNALTDGAVAKVKNWGSHDRKRRQYLNSLRKR